MEKNMIKKQFINNQKKIENKKTSKEERKLLIMENKRLLEKIGKEGK